MIRYVNRNNIDNLKEWIGNIEEFPGLRDNIDYNYFDFSIYYNSPPKRYVYGFFLDNKLEGILKINRSPNWLDSLLVNPMKQGKGIGSYLMEYGLDKTPLPIKLEVYEENKRALKMYKKYGFKYMNKYKEFVEWYNRMLTVVVMIKN